MTLPMISMSKLPETKRERKKKPLQSSTSSSHPSKSKKPKLSHAAPIGRNRVNSTPVDDGDGSNRDDMAKDANGGGCNGQRSQDDGGGHKSLSDCTVGGAGHGASSAVHASTSTPSTSFAPKFNYKHPMVSDELWEDDRQNDQDEQEEKKIFQKKLLKKNIFEEEDADDDMKNQFESDEKESNDDEEELDNLF